MPRRIQTEDKECIECHKLFNRGRLKSGREESIEDYNKRKFCSRRCYFKHNTGENHWLWKGGIKRRPDGYLRDGKTDKYIHRETMEHHLGRKLRSDEFIHHKGVLYPLDSKENRADNRIGNLEIMSNSLHRKIHCANQKRDRNGRFVKEVMPNDCE